MKMSKFLAATLASLTLLMILTLQAPAQKPGDTNQPTLQYVKDLTDIVNKMTTLADRAHTMSKMASQQLQSGKGNQNADLLRKLQEFDLSMGALAETVKTNLQNFIHLREDPALSINAALGPNLDTMQNQLKTLAENLSSALATLEKMNKQLLGGPAK
jgi:hypothetical protein